MRRSRWIVPVMVLGLAVVSAGCSYKVKDYCDVDTPCPDPERSFCDLDGAYPASEYIANTCIPDPNLDGGVIDAGVADAASDADLGSDAALPASLSMTPEDDDFGSVTEGNQSGSLTFSVDNPGGLSTGVLAVSLSNPGDFAIVTDECNGNALAPAASCAITVRFQPQSAGDKNATLDVSTTPGGTAQATITGTGLAVGDLTITPTPWGFGAIVEGGSSSPRTFVVKNTGGSASGTISTDLVDTTNFTIVSDTCDGATLAAAAQCTIEARFDPAASTGGAINTTLSVSATPGGTAAASLSGTGLSFGELSISPTSPSFGSVVVGNHSSTQQFTVHNIGESATGTISTTLLDSTNYSLQGDECGGTSLAADDECNIWVRFEPASAGDHDTTLTVSATPGGNAIALLDGTGVAAGDLSISPTTWDFGSVTSGSASVAKTFLVQNSGGSSTGTISTTLVDTANYSIQSDGCAGTILAASAQCSIVARFEPSATGGLNTDLSVSATPGGTAATSLSGVGLSPAQLRIAPVTWNFGSFLIGSTSTTKAFVVDNIGQSPTGTIGAATLLDDTHFEITSDLCSGIALAAGEQCNIVARFAPQSAGALDTTLSVSTSPGGGVTSSLNGTGLSLGTLSISPTAPDFGSVAVGSTSSAQHFVVENTGGTSTGTISTTLVDTTNYNLTDNCVGTSLAVGAQCTIDISFEPMVAGDLGTSLTVSASPGGDAMASLGATGTAQLAVSKSGSGTVTSTPAGISCGSTCGATFSASPVSLAATPGDTATFTGWSLGSCPGTGPCSVTMDGDKSVSASFVTNQLAIAGVSHREGNHGATIFAFEVTLSPASSQTVSVNYATADGTATTADQDYVAVSGVKTFAPGDTSETIEVTVLADRKSELDQTFTVTLSSPGHAAITTAHATGTIEDDDHGFDLNGDGFADMVVGAPYRYGSGGDSGVVFIYYGSATPTASLDTGDADVTLIGGADGDLFGNDVTTGDVNGDGSDDVVVGAGGVDVGGTSAGAVYVFYGPIIGSLYASEADVELTGEAEGDEFGTHVASADVNGDGLADILVGAQNDDDGGPDSGCAFVFLGSSSLPATINASAAAVKLVGEADGDYFGYSIANAGDFNGDGLEDIVVGASSHASHTGAAYLFFGETGWSGTTVDASSADVTIAGDATEDRLGAAVGGAVDVNGDGKDDVVIGAILGGAYTGGAGYVFFGTAYSSPQALSASDANFTLVGTNSGWDLGRSVNGIGDIDGDGFGDFIIGQLGYGTSAFFMDIGRVHVIRGSATLSGTHLEGSGVAVVIDGSRPLDSYGNSTSTGFDFNRDGYHDFAVGGLLEEESSMRHADLILGGNPLTLPAGSGAADSVITSTASGDWFGTGLQ